MRTIKGYVSTGYVGSAKREFTFEVEDIEETYMGISMLMNLFL